MFEPAPCNETISIVAALLRGVDGACIDISLGSILGGVVVFIAAVATLRFVGAWLLRRIFSGFGRRTPEETEGVKAGEDGGLKPMPYESPIQSTGAWGNRRR